MKKSAIVSTVAALALPIAAFAAEDDDFFAQLSGENPAVPAPAAEVQPAPAAASLQDGGAGQPEPQTEEPAVGGKADSPFSEQMTKDLSEVLGRDFAEQAVAASDEKKRLYYVLPECTHISNGKAEVLIPGSTEWKEAKEGCHYPLGSQYRTVGSNARLIVSLGLGINVKIKGEASFGMVAQPLGVKSRTITLRSGVITVTVPSNMPKGLLTVSATGFKAFNMTGVTRYSCRESADGEDVLVRCVTGKFDLEGRHFRAAEIRTASVLRIRTSHDLLYTGIFGVRGDCDLRLDQGRFVVKDLESGEDKIEDRYLDWKLSPDTAVRIYRMRPEIGKNMAVSVLTFNDKGVMKNRCAFTENRHEINTGELGPTSKKDREEMARRAAQATETITVETAAPAAAVTTVEPQPADSGAVEPSAPAAAEPAAVPADQPAEVKFEDLDL